MRLLVIVPALNEEASIATVVQDARKNLGADVLVVDDGSTDETASRAVGAGATVCSLPYNLGVGGAIRTALRFAQMRGYDQVLQIDGDGQHDATEAQLLLNVLAADGADLVIGSRFAAGYRVSRGRRTAMRMLSTILSRRLGTSISDTTSGFRAMNRKALDLFARDYPVDYLSDTVEALLIAGDAGLRVAEVPVQMHERETGTPSASRFRSAYHLTRLLLVIFLRSIRRRQSRKD